MQFEAPDQTFQLRLGRFRERLARISQTEKNSVFRPSRKLQSAERKGNFVGSCRNARPDRSQGRRSASERMRAMDSPACASVDSASCAGNEPTLKIAGVGRIDFPHSAVDFAKFKNFSARERRKRGRACPKRAACSLRHKQPQAHDGAVSAAIPDPIEPENPEREHPVYCCGAFARRRREQRPLARILMHAAAHVESGKGVFKIGRGS